MSSIESLIEKITSKAQTITLAFDDPQIKPAVLQKLVEAISRNSSVLYLDFDLQFSSLLQNLEQDKFERISSNFSLIHPSEDILEFVAALFSRSLKPGGVIILDSLNTLQSLLTEQSQNSDSKAANQKTALIVTILQEISRFYTRTLLIVNITKARPRDASESSSSFWEKVLVGGRMIKFKSDLILSVKLIFRLGSHAIEIASLEADSGETTASEKYLF